MVLADPHQNQKLFREFLVCSGHYSGKNISSHRFARYCLKTEPRSIHETKELQKGKLTKNGNHKGKFQKSKKYIQDLNSEDHAHSLLWTPMSTELSSSSSGGPPRTSGSHGALQSQRFGFRYTFSRDSNSVWSASAKWAESAWKPILWDVYCSFGHFQASRYKQTAMVALPKGLMLLIQVWRKHS